MQRDQIHSYLQEASGVIDALITPTDEPLSIDELVNAALNECAKLPSDFLPYSRQIGELQSRLAHGRLHLAVLGEFKRGKSTFVNGLIGMKLLPTSVLPITTVPTRIVYGPDLSCTIRFLADKPPVVIRSSRESVTAALLKHVAEEYNPKNHLGVSSVEVSVPSPLLENGTVLIDTPGFGSTYLHNTRTALDVLNDCDAALFLLSADPPMTQTEMEFIKQVMKHVPRIFFILNKIDLLTTKQKQKVERFIVDILKTGLNLDERPHLFHVCARQAENSRMQTSDDPQWASSGMETIKEDIIRFLAREKYFTLSQALSEKLKDAISCIIAILQKEKESFEEPIARLRSERDAFIRERTAVNKMMEKERSLIPAEKKAIMKFLDEQLSSGKPKLFARIHDAMKILLDSSPCDAASCKNVSSAINALIPEAFASFRAQVIAILNRPIKKSIILHIREFDAIMQSVNSCIAGMGAVPQSNLRDRLETIEIEPDDSPPGVRYHTDDFSVAIQWIDRFFGRQKRIRRLHERYDHRLDEMLGNLFFVMSKQLRQHIETLFASIEQILAEEYETLSKQLENIMKSKDESISCAIERSGPGAALRAERIESFRRILMRLR